MAGLLAIAWLLLWLAGYPRPNVDDSFFAGAAAHLAATGHLANPWIAGWMGYLPGVHADKFLVQPPLYPVILAGWIKFVGLSAASLTGFACLLGGFASLALWWLFFRLTAMPSAAWLAAGVGGGWLLFRGLRPEMLALGLAAASQLCLLAGTPTAWLAGGALGAAAVVAHPFWLVFVVPGALLALVIRRRDPRPIARVGAMAAGVGLVAGGLALGLRGNFVDFVHDLLAHARFVAPADGRLASFLAHYLVGYDGWRNLVLLALAVAGVVACGGKPVAVIAGSAGVLALSFLLYAAQSATVVMLCTALVPLVLNGSSFGWRRWLCLAPAALLLASFGVQHLLQWLADRRHDVRPYGGEVAAYLAAAHPEQVLFDAGTLRTVFDYRPPEGAMDLAWAWSPGRSDRWRSPVQLAPRDLWVVAPAWSHRQLPAEARRERLVLLGHTFDSVHTSRSLLLVTGSALPAPAGLPFLRSPRVP
ncbi:MAG TPA: hypothetical protein VL200_02320 [Lacunisphaera sp.]|nr:hypothetical protein [Lacunisphaera sp.]